MDFEKAIDNFLDFFYCFRDQNKEYQAAYIILPCKRSFVERMSIEWEFTANRQDQLFTQDSVSFPDLLRVVRSYILIACPMDDQFTPFYRKNENAYCFNWVDSSTTARQKNKSKTGSSKQRL